MSSLMYKTLASPFSIRPAFNLKLKILQIFTWLAVALSVFSMRAAIPVPTTAWYIFTNNAANDITGNGNDGALNSITFGNGYSTDIDGTNAAIFDGTSSYIDLGDASGFTNVPFTYTAWIKLADTNSIHTIIGGGLYHPQFFVAVGGLLSLNADNAAVLPVSTSPVPGDGNWHFVCVTYHSVGTAGAVTFYIDGGNAGPGYPANVVYEDWFSQNSDAVLGKNSFINSEYFKGSMADVRFFDHDISSYEINELYDRTALDTNVWYVDNTATNGNRSGTTWSNAFLSITEGINFYTPGNTIYVSGGPTNSSQTYSADKNLTLQGNSTYRLTISIGQDSLHGGKAIFDGGGADQFLFEGLGYLTLTGNYNGQTNIILTNFNNSLLGDGVIGWTIDHIISHDPVRFNGSTNITLSNDILDVSGHLGADYCVFWNVLSDTGSPSYTNNTIRNCVLVSPCNDSTSANPGYGVDAIEDGAFSDVYSNYFKTVFVGSNYFGSQHQDGWQLNGIESNLRLHDNVFENTAGYNFWNGGLGTGSCSNILIYNNIFEKTGLMANNTGLISEAITITLGVTGQYASNIVIANNTFVDFLGRGAIIWGDADSDPTAQSPTQTNCYIVNNIIYDCGGTGYAAMEYYHTVGVDEHSLQGMLFANNEVKAGISGNTDTFVTQSAYPSGTPPVKFIDYSQMSTGNDLHLAFNDLAATKQALNLSSSLPFLTVDKDGLGRPASGNWDIGAFQNDLLEIITLNENTNFNMGFLSESNVTYTVYASTDLATWSSIGTVTATGTNTSFADTSASSYTSRFYYITDGTNDSQFFGYFNITVAPGYAAIGDPLLNLNGNTVGMLITNVPNGTIFYKYDESTQSFPFANEITGAVWADTNATLLPGEGAFIENAGTADFTLTFCGLVAQGNLSCTIPPNISLRSSMVPLPLSLDALDFPAVDGDEFVYEDGSEQLRVYFEGFGWYDGSGDVPNPPVTTLGQAFYIESGDSSSRTWTHNFIVTP